MLVIRILAACSLGVAAVPACGLFSARQAEKSLSPAGSEIMLEVKSHHWNDIVIYLMNGSQSRRVGMVAGVSTARFVFPYRQLVSGGRARLRAYAVGGGGSITSEDLLVQQGQWIKLTLESDLARSSLAVH